MMNLLVPGHPALKNAPEPPVDLVGPRFGTYSMSRFKYVTVPSKPYIVILNLAAFSDPEVNKWMEFYEGLYPEHHTEMWDCYSLGCINRAKEAAQLLHDCQIDQMIVLHDPAIPDQEYLVRTALSEWELSFPFEELAWQPVTDL